MARMATVHPVAASETMNDMEDLKVAGFWSKLDDSDADADSAGSYGEIADKHRATLLEGKTEGDIPRDEMERGETGSGALMLLGGTR